MPNKINSPSPVDVLPYVIKHGDPFDMDLFSARAAAVGARHGGLVNAMITTLTEHFVADRLTAYLSSRLIQFAPCLHAFNQQQAQPLTPLGLAVVGLLALGHRRALEALGTEGAYRQHLCRLLGGASQYPDWGTEASTEEWASSRAAGAGGAALATTYAGRVTVQEPQVPPVIEVELSHLTARSLEAAIERGVQGMVPSAVASHEHAIRSTAAAAAVDAARQTLHQAGPHVAATATATAQHVFDQALPGLASVASGQANAALRAAAPELEAYIQARLQPLLGHLARLEAAVVHQQASRPTVPRAVIPQPAAHRAGLDDDGDDDDDLDGFFAARSRGRRAPAAALKPAVFLQGSRVLATLEEAGVGVNVGATGAARSLWETRVMTAIPAGSREEAERAFELALTFLERNRVADQPELARPINAELSRWGVAAYAGMAHGAKAAAFMDEGGPSLEVRRALHATALAGGGAGDRARAAAYGSAPSAADVERAALLDASRPKKAGHASHAAKEKKNAATPAANSNSNNNSGPGNGKGREGK